MNLLIFPALFLFILAILKRKKKGNPLWYMYRGGVDFGSDRTVLVVAQVDKRTRIITIIDATTI